MNTKKATEVPLGVSVSFLEEFLSKTLNDKSLTTSDSLARIVLPATKKTKSTYCSLFEKTKNPKGVPFVSNANIFVSHAWRYKLTDVIQTCLDYAKVNHFGKSAKPVYFWIDLFVNNQNTAQSNDQSWWKNKFRQSVGVIGHTLLVLSPWNNPIPLTRAWCLWEVLCTVQEGAVLDVALPSSEHASFNEAIKNDFTAILTEFSNIQSKNAEASRAEDKEMIFKQIQATHSFHQLDSLVKDQLRHWLFTNAEKIVATLSSSEQNLETGKLLIQIASWYSQLGKLREAQQLFSRAEKIFNSFSDPSRTAAKELGLASLFNNRGYMYCEQGKNEEALDNFEKSLQLRQKHEKDTMEMASLYNNVGSVYGNVGDHEKAFEYYEKDMKIKEKLVTDQSTAFEKYSLATSLNNLSMFHLNYKNDSGKAKKLCEKALKLAIESYGEDHYGLDKYYECLGTIYLYNNEFSLAIETLEKAVKISRVNLGPDHLNLGNIRTTLGLAYKKNGNNEQAIEQYKESERVLLLSDGQNSPAISNLYHNLASVQAETGDFAGSIEYRLKDLRICEQKSGQSEAADLNLFGCLNNLAVCYFHNKQFKKAVECYEKSTVIAKSRFGVESSEYLRTKDDLDIAKSYLQDEDTK